MFFKIDCSFNVYGPEVYCRPFLCGVDEGKVYWKQLEPEDFDVIEDEIKERKEKEFDKSRVIYSSDR